MESMDRDRLARQSILCAAEKLGYPMLKAEQLDVLLHFVEGRDVFAVLPTGFGKSLCYACLPLAFDRLLEREEGYTIAVVVTPLLAIMKDQVFNLLLCVSRNPVLLIACTH